MARSIVLAGVVVLLGAYLFGTWDDTVCFGPKQNFSVTLEKLSPIPARIPAVKEINYFETDKNIANWLVRYEDGRITRRRSRGPVTQGSHSMEVRWNVNRWGEIVLLHFPEDWERYRFFAFDAVYPGEGAAECELRIGDYFDSDSLHIAEAGFVSRMVLAPGVNRFRFPMKDIARAIDIASERKTICFRFSPSPLTVYLDNMRLER